MGSRRVFYETRRTIDTVRESHQCMAANVNYNNNSNHSNNSNNSNILQDTFSTVNMDTNLNMPAFNNNNNSINDNNKSMDFYTKFGIHITGQGQQQHQQQQQQHPQPQPQPQPQPRQQQSSHNISPNVNSIISNPNIVIANKNDNNSNNHNDNSHQNSQFDKQIITLNDMSLEPLTTDAHPWHRMNRNKNNHSNNNNNNMDNNLNDINSINNNAMDDLNTTANNMEDDTVSFASGSTFTLHSTVSGYSAASFPNLQNHGLRSNQNNNHNHSNKQASDTFSLSSLPLSLSSQTQHFHKNNINKYDMKPLNQTQTHNTNAGMPMMCVLYVLPCCLSVCVCAGVFFFLHKHLDDTHIAVLILSCVLAWSVLLTLQKAVGQNKKNDKQK